jgi:glycosyltransferase involved in cell wall biosynthesis
MRFSIIIPTFNRSKKLRECLQALFAQTYDSSEYEILVIDDGSEDDTAEVVKKLVKKSPVPLRIFVQSNSGQGVARNRGIDEAIGEIILFLGDDIVATPDLLREHDRVHLRHPEENAAALGFITWHPKLSISPLMRFMERGGAIFGRFGGHQFAYDLLAGKTKADFRFFYTSNISLKRTLLTRFKFDPWFAGYGWEDIELGYRLEKQAGLALFYAPQAVAHHDHMMMEKDFVHRMRAIGESSIRFHQKYPELRKIPSHRKQLALRVLSSRLALACMKPVSRNLYFYALSKKYFLEGMKKGIMRNDE